MKILIVIQTASEVCRILADYFIESLKELRIQTSFFEYIPDDTNISIKKKTSLLLTSILSTETNNNFSYGDTHSLEKHIRRLKPDIMLAIKADKLPCDFLHYLKKSIPSLIIANYWIDDPHYFDISSKISPLYDFFFTNSPSCVSKHKLAGSSNPAYLSFGCMPKIHNNNIPLSPSEKHKHSCDICFAGTLDITRLRVLESIADLNLKVYSEHYYNQFEQGGVIKKIPIPTSSPIYAKITGYRLWGKELVKAYNCSKIAINIHSPQNAPIMRDYETTACGTMLLTDNAEGLEDKFKIGNEIVCFSSEKELKKIALEYLANETKRKEIAINGMKRSHTEHTYLNRVQEMLSFIQLTKK